ncbi:MAG TPA: PilN domain-containing protein, partial [Chthoniobacterales bacterium]
GDRMLVAAQIFPAALPAEFSHPAFAFFNASPLFAALAPNGLHLWREGADLVAVFTRGEEPVFWETLPATASRAEIFSWLERAGLSLAEEEVIPQSLTFHDFTGTAATPSYCESAPASPAPHPLLREALPACDWKSPARMAREASNRKKKNLRGIAEFAAAVYLGSFLTFAGWAGWQHWRAAKLRDEIAAIEPEVRRLQKAGKQWDILVPTVEGSFFPLEILHRIIQKMPPDGVRLTQYDFDNPKIGIQGEAKSVSAAAELLAGLSGTDGLSHVRWEMPPPALLPNNTARFAISGELTDEKN